MNIDLPKQLKAPLNPLFELLPPSSAMNELVVTENKANQELIKQVATILTDPTIAPRQDLAAGLWLYVDNLDKSHQISQALDGATGAFWHAIMHRREGDFSNSKHWYRSAAGHPALELIQLPNCKKYNPNEFVDRAEQAHQNSSNNDLELIDLQRREWAALFQWCVDNP